MQFDAKADSRLDEENRRLNSEISNLRKELEAAKEERLRLRNATLQDSLRQSTSPTTAPLHPVAQGDNIQSLLQSPLVIALFIFVFVIGISVGKLFM